VAKWNKKNVPANTHIIQEKLDMWHYVVHVDHHMLYQGVTAPPTVCGAEAYSALKSCARGEGKYSVVGRFLMVALPGSAGPPLVRSTAYAPALNENAALTACEEDTAAEDAVLAAFDAAVREARLWLRLAWIPDGDVYLEEVISEDDAACPCVGHSSIQVRSL